MPGLRVIKVTPGKLVNGRFVPATKNPKRKKRRKGTKYKIARLREMIREATAKKRNAKRRKKR